MIKKEQVLKFQKEWGDGIIHIGKVFSNNGDYVNEAKLFINKFYAYSFESVLFKPTLSGGAQTFRTNNDIESACAAVFSFSRFAREAAQTACSKIFCFIVS